jgi:hypothetical protein
MIRTTRIVAIGSLVAFGAIVTSQMGSTAPSTVVVSSETLLDSPDRRAVAINADGSLIITDASGFSPGTSLDLITRSTGARQNLPIAGPLSGASSPGQFRAMFDVSGQSLIVNTTSSYAAADTDSDIDVYRYTLTTSSWSLLSGALPPATYVAVDVSADGRYVLVQTISSGIAFGSYRLDTTSGAALDIGPQFATVPGIVASPASSMSADGRFIAVNVLQSFGATNHAYVLDATALTYVPVDVSPAGVQGDGPSRGSVISDDGQWVAFGSDATNLVPGTTPSTIRVYLRNLATTVTTLVGAGALPVGRSITEHGERLMYADSVVQSNTLHVYDRFTAQDEVVVSSTAISNPMLSADGRVLVYDRSTTTPVVPTSTTPTATTFTSPGTPTVQTFTVGLSAPAIAPPARTYSPLAPARFLDTRATGQTVDGRSQAGGLQVPGATLRVQIAGRGSVPVGAAAAVLNITATGSTGAGFVTAWPCDSTSPPNASNLNFSAGRDVANLVAVRLNAAGEVCLQAGQSSVHLIADASGYFSAGQGFDGLAPARLLDTRPSGQTVDGVAKAGGLRPAGSTLRLQVGGRGGVPSSGVGAVAMNVTVTGATGSGFITVWPCDSTEPPNASNLNFSAGVDVPNMVIAPMSPSGEVCLFVSGSATHLIADVSGVVRSTATYQATAPKRLLDTRSGGSTVDQRFAGGGMQAAAKKLELDVRGRGGVPAGATAVVINVTVTQPTGSGFLTAWPCNSAEPPNASNLNFKARSDVPNLVIVPISPTGTVCLQASAATQLIADVSGWFSS